MDLTVTILQEKGSYSEFPLSLSFLIDNCMTLLNLREKWINSTKKHFIMGTSIQFFSSLMIASTKYCINEIWYGDMIKRLLVDFFKTMLVARIVIYQEWKQSKTVWKIYWKEFVLKGGKTENQELPGNLYNIGKLFDHKVVRAYCMNIFLVVINALCT